jgi:hypothetical protein
MRCGGTTRDAFAYQIRRTDSELIGLVHNPVGQCRRCAVATDLKYPCPVVVLVSMVGLELIYLEGQ